MSKHNTPATPKTLAALYPDTPVDFPVVLKKALGEDDWNLNVDMTQTFYQGPTDDLLPDTTQALVPHTAGGYVLAQGLELTEEMTVDQKLALSGQVFSYIGVIPKKIDEYAGNEWHTMIGAMIVPLSDEGKVDKETGEVLRRAKKWIQPLFKLSTKDERTGNHVILAGGGKYGKMFAETMLMIFGAGDWPMPVEVKISQQGLDPGTDGTPRRMYRFMHRMPQSK